MADPANHLYYGDNLAILRDRIESESVDLIYLDPPFNSNATYNVLFKSHDGVSSPAQIEAFDDSWHWSSQTDELFDSMIGGGCPSRVADALVGMRNLLGTSDINAYLVMMTARLVELYRVLKPTGTLYLHCDPTASHYLKVMLDAIFGPTNFGNEVIWAYKYGGRSKNHFGRKHDVILRYMKSKKFTFNSDDPEVRIPHEEASLEANYRFTDEAGRRYREGTWSSGKKYRYYADEGRLRDDVWVDLNSLHQADAERLGYPTQKPLSLLELIVRASSGPNDLVLDPFCGCGTTIDAAQKLGRRWIGIDVTYIAVDLIRNRLRHTYGHGIEQNYRIHGIPADLAGARALFDENPFDFERWVVSLIDGTPNEKQVGDKGIDGRVRFYADEKKIGQVLVSVKGGKTVNPAMVRDLVGTVQRESAEMGILITLTKPTPGMVEEAKKSGTYVSPLTGQTYPKVQIITTGELMAHKKPVMPSAILPYIKATPRKQGEQLRLD